MLNVHKIPLENNFGIFMPNPHIVTNFALLSNMFDGQTCEKKYIDNDSKVVYF